MRGFYAVIAGLVLSCLVLGNDWPTCYRLATYADIAQTRWAMENGWGESNPLLRGRSRLETALVQAAFCELEIWAIGRLPRRLRPFVGFLAVLDRLRPVVSNHRKGVPSSGYMPVVSIRFRS